MLRSLSPQEVYAQAEALHQREIWERVRDLTRHIYGQQAHTLEISQVFTEPDTNKVGYCLVTTIEEWEVSDVQGNPLTPDETSDFWQPHQAVLQRARTRGTTRATIFTLIQSALGEVVPALTETYQLDDPPVIPFQAVYVDE